MKCNNYLCTHNFSKECELEEIEIDWRGNCKNMKYICLSTNDIRSHKLYTNLLLDSKMSFDATTGKYNRLQKDTIDKE